MKARNWLWLMALAVLPAAAQMPDRGPHRYRYGDGQPLPPAAVPMPMPMRPQNFRREDLPVPGRLTPEERRQLRRDIQDAGQDLYRRGPRHRPF